MATVTEEQKKEHREQFIKDCRQKAWGAACHAEWISKGLDSVVAAYKNLQDEDRAVGEGLRKASEALDNHTDEGQTERKALRNRWASIQTALETLAKKMQQGHDVLNGRYKNIEASLALAKHAEMWERKEAAAATTSEVQSTE